MMYLAGKDAGTGTNYQINVDNGLISAGLGWMVDYNSTGCCDDRYAKYVTAISTGVWYHLAGVYDSTAHSETLYLNGVSVASFDATGLAPQSSSGHKPGIGVELGAVTSHYTNGTIDDVRIYNRALSASEVWRLYNGAP